MTETFVHEQYEAYPYPPRDPRDELRRLIVGSPGHLDEVNHYVFGGRRDFSKPFRVLVAGGGTGDSTVMLAQQLSDRGTPAEIVYIDLSEASLAIAEERVRARQLASVRFLRASLLELPGMDLGAFDYIDCCGVLHHLAEPLAGLSALSGMLNDAGGMGLMLYGALGRTGVYPVQEMVRMIAPPEWPPEERLSTAKVLLQHLPASNWLKRNPFVRDHLTQGDAGLYDLLLHTQDRAYRVPEIADMVSAAGLRLITFVEPAFYDPRSYISEEGLRALTDGLSWINRCAFAEALAGTMRKHVFYAVRADNPVVPMSPAEPTAIPVLRELDGNALAGQFGTGAALSATIDGLSFRRPLPSLTPAILRLVDGERSVSEIHRDMPTKGTAIDWSVFATQFRRLYGALNGLGKIYLRGR